MFGYIIGKPVDLSPTHTYLEVNGIGYDVHITLPTYEVIRNASGNCRLFTYLQVREDAWTLFGFATLQEKEAFQRLLSVSGVGAATARILLSSIKPDDLSEIVYAGDSKPLEKVKGIGAKTAQRIILELKGKLPLQTDNELNGGAHNTNEQDALNALIGLGIGKATAQSALNKAKTKSGADSSVEEWIKEALKCL